ncbi:Fe-S cluster assembly protein SufD [Pelagicoccus sp. SDUM812003]|uniref:Fe-S cluster assembly protein SufD n=1 Tax=Pelagicoccus sp. SDUM812003 TaxID=3041267 RepID=UPI00280CECA8|nr:Fe-S cluster assembly protein SufD [Pelagicoccus sp. SDUM812003]MDQ8202014.1 Fe-S cluster assembly protein SufD [Pelagicoccus sp. SDUM812003]
MSESSEVVSKIREAFGRHIEDLDTAPSWWKDAKNEAFEQFSTLPMPTRKDESWRFANVKNLGLDAFKFAALPSIADAAKLVERSDFLDAYSGRFVFGEDQTLKADRVSPELAEKGVIWAPLKEAISKHGEILKDYFMKQEADLGSAKFAALHHAFLENGALLYVPKGVEIEDPFVVYNWSINEGSAIFPHTLIIAEEFSKVRVVEANLSASDETTAYSCGVNHIFAGVGASVDYTLLQNFNEKTLGFQINSNIAGKDSNVKTLSVNVGCEHYRSETHGQIKGPGSKVEMLSLAVADYDQEIDQRTLQTHSAPNAVSDLLFKNALVDNAKTIFSGLIKVDPGAQQTDAYQTNRNLLLSNSAEANSLPGLEIDANDVKCSHGATTAQIDDEEIFYMKARGIPENRAQELIVYGFFEEILNRIDCEKLADRAREIIQDKFRKRLR